ncbi:MAG: hypothetical protein VB034_02845 [Eubacteriales bacterium]|nr:hypothetical protein [Eubacteriales bacterium]
MGLFGNSEKKRRALATPLATPATIVVTCNSMPVHNKATYWFEVVLNGEIVGKIEQNATPLTVLSRVDKNLLELNLFVKENNGRVTPFGGRNQALDLTDGQTVNVVFENRRFTVT